MNGVYIFLGITLLVINVIVVINIVKAGKYAKLTYELIAERIRKMNLAEVEQQNKKHKDKIANTETDVEKFKNLKEVWKEIDNENN